MVVIPCPNHSLGIKHLSLYTSVSTVDIEIKRKKVPSSDFIAFEDLEVINHLTTFPILFLISNLMLNFRLKLIETLWV